MNNKNDKKNNFAILNHVGTGDHMELHAQYLDMVGGGIARAAGVSKQAHRDKAPVQL